MKLRHPYQTIPSLVVCSAFLILAGCDAPRPIPAADATSSPSPSPTLGLSVQDGKFFLQGRPYRGVGVNYYDLFTRLSAKPGDLTTLENLATIARAGVPFARFNAAGFTTRDWENYLADPNAHFATMDRVVRAAEQAGIGLIPSLFWTSNLCKAVGERKEAWGDPKSRTFAAMQAYTKAMVARYIDSPAIWAWEFGNEWNLNADLPNAKDQRKPGEDERDDLKNTQLSVALDGFASAVRALDPRRPIMTGHSHPRAAAWHNTHEKSWKPDSYEQWQEVLSVENPAAFDTVGIHIYADTEANEACGKWTSGWPDYLSRLKSYAAATKRPLFIGEFGLAEGGKFSPEQVKVRFRDILTAMNANGTDLAAVWVFDLPSQSKDWSITFTNARAYMLEDVIAANRQWQAAPAE